MSNKMFLSKENLTRFLIENINMDSNTIPLWLLEINHGNVPEEDFENAFQYERADDVIELLDNCLTAVWLFQINENDLGETVFETNTYEAMRRTYIEMVQQRMDTVYDLINTSLVNVKLMKPFAILTVWDVNIEFEKLNRTQTQRDLARAMKEQMEKDKKEGRVLN